MCHSGLKLWTPNEFHEQEEKRLILCQLQGEMLLTEVRSPGGQDSNCGNNKEPDLRLEMCRS